MRPTSQRILSAALIVIVSAAILLALSGAILSLVLAKKVKAELESVNASIGSLRINLFTRGIRIKDFEWSPKTDTTKTDSAIHLPHRIRIEDLHASGVRLISLLRDRKVSIRKLTIENGSISINQAFNSVDTTATSTDSIPIQSFDVDRLVFSGIDVRIGRDSLTEYSALLNLSFSNVTLDSIAAFRELSAYGIRSIEAVIEDLHIQKAGSLYAFDIQTTTFNNERMLLQLDSIKVVPLISRRDFGPTTKSQDTRTELTVAQVVAEGVNMAVHMQDTSVMIKSARILHPVIWAYKDKRYPFTRKEKFELPMAMFQSLDINIEIDTIKFEHGTITYEEFPAEGFKTGRIRFEDVNATMSSVNNRSFNNMASHATLKANGRLMNTGRIDATFQLPLEKGKRYEAKGTLTRVPLAELNPFLENVVFVEIASGTLNRLDFAFSYDDVGSTGEVQFDYEDLRIRTLKKEGSGDVATIKTVLVNTAVKNDRSIVGPIDIKRNQQKAVFNLWAISIVDGIRRGFVPGRERGKDPK